MRNFIYSNGLAVRNFAAGGSACPQDDDK